LSKRNRKEDEVMIPVSSAAAAEKQIDQLQSVVNAIILATVVIILADAAAEKDVEFLGLKMGISTAYGVAAWTFILATVMVAQLFARLADRAEVGAALGNEKGGVGTTSSQASRCRTHSSNRLTASCATSASTSTC
jgi:hypothetical protein